MLPAIKSFACTCVGPTTPRAGLTRAQAVFYGIVIDAPAQLAQTDLFRKPRNKYLTGNPEWQFKVERVWKGKKIKQQVKVRSTADANACGASFEKFSSYIVFAEVKKIGRERIYFVQHCNWTSGYKQTPEIINEIGEGRLVKK